MATIPLAVPRARPRLRVRYPAAYLALLPAAVIVVVAYLGCMLWTARLSFTSSKLLPKLDWVGVAQYQRLFENERFVVSVENIVIFGVLYLVGALVFGFLLFATWALPASPSTGS
jgi:glucose/mannose transport system permease protein